MTLVAVVSCVSPVSNSRHLTLLPYDVAVVAWITRLAEEP